MSNLFIELLWTLLWPDKDEQSRSPGSLWSGSFQKGRERSRGPCYLLFKAGKDRSIREPCKVGGR